MNLPMVQILLACILIGFAGKSSSACVFVYVQGLAISTFWSMLFGLLVKNKCLVPLVWYFLEIP